jgi:transcriptional regulator with XRE-family HTH domain
MIIGDRLRAIREEKKLSQGDIEKRTGLLRCYISRVENGHTVPAIETLEKMARALEIPLYQLFYDGEKPPPLPTLPNRRTAGDLAWGSSGKDSRYLMKFRQQLSRMDESDRRLLLFNGLRKCRAALMRHTLTDRSFAPPALCVRGLDTNASNRFHREAIRKGIHPYGAGRGGPMELQCPNCKSTDLKKISLAYQEGLQHVSARTRLRGVVVGSDGPDVIVGRATTKGTQQTEISKPLTPPNRWSYLKLCGWSALVFLSVGWIVLYVNTITTNSSSVSSVPLTIYAVLSGGLFVVLFLVYWKHNHTAYPREYAHWNRSFICERCGTVSEQELRATSLS